MFTSPTPDQIGGVLFGSAYGDALAAPTEFIHSLAYIRQSFAPNGPTDLHGGRVTDDTQMMLTVARALLDAPELIPAALETTLRAEFTLWLHDPENNRAPGHTCLTACRNLQRGGAWQAATVTRSKGCGANMRVQPVGLIADDATRAGAAQLQAALTHGHPTALAAADLTAQAIWLLISGTAPPQLAQALTAHAQAQREVYRADWLGDVWQYYGASDPQHYISEGWDECLGVLGRLEAALTSDIHDDADPCDLTGEGWIAEEAFATGLLCFLLTPTDPVESLRRAAVTKGDSDSLACLAGAFAGAYLGLGAFPAQWRGQIEYAEELRRCSAAFEVKQLK
ncbi:ADP-ribosylglycohydrolase family protein [Deinococcus rubellus]|uniref:ADP-ribosylglycohydrolase family protein n=1 Tax=Deinococcus rubellus TaxID=1889240 RepID=A0ABY5YLC8_9DEIO|nr:ADP-ribosylglycohydrolase family protein [Deinococcus rubellus]UWX65152.1 ADP-ribosylglycohydrolase family protein [Deinococcus rubellus]